MEKQFKVLEENAKMRLDVYIAQFAEVSRSLASTLISSGKVYVNGEVSKANYKVKTGDDIAVEEISRPELDVVAEPMDIDIVYEDDDVIIVNKQSGVVVHPAVGAPTGTLVNGLMHLSKQLSNVNGEFRPGVVHRIDKNTSGLIMFAKNDKAHECLSEQLQAKTTTRKYIALVHGVIPEDKLVIDAPIGRDQADRKKMTVTAKNSKQAITNVTVLKRFNDYTLVECQLTTGRTHQIRVHMKFVEYPIVGDPEYGRKKSFDCEGQALHAKTLGFIHPTTNEYIEFDSELPKAMTDVIAIIEEQDADA
ncbi:RluA family pseudouridine synthase [Mollicutes bacterium LVI A0039]|nr:RluA family pseudouridine synthase [Mollicutes bacterium LVI A0039]